MAPRILTSTLLLLLHSSVVTAEYYLCNVCQNSNDGYRYLADPDGESFVNPSTGDTWTCGDLQDAVQDVNPTSSGAAGEARLCYIYQIYAEQYCTCAGPEVPSLFEEYEDINAPCNLCEGYELNYVPNVNNETTVDTSMFGTQNCLGLYEAALEGDVLDEDSCDSVWSEFEACCSIPDLPDSGNGSGGGGSDSGSGGSDTGGSSNGGNNNGGNGNSGGGSSNGGNGGESSNGSDESSDNDNPEIGPILTFVGAVVALILLNVLICYVLCKCFGREK